MTRKTYSMTSADQKRAVTENVRRGWTCRLCQKGEKVTVPGTGAPHILCTLTGAQCSPEDTCANWD